MNTHHNSMKFSLRIKRFLKENVFENILTTRAKCEYLHYLLTINDLWYVRVCNGHTSISADLVVNVFMHAQV